jgi:CBS domain-containing protein
MGQRHTHHLLHLKAQDIHSIVLGPRKESWQVKLTDPATSIMTDFRESAFFTVDSDELIVDALEKMKHAGLRSAFVMDRNSEKLLGMITAYDIMGEKPLRYLQSTGLVKHTDIQVADVMEELKDMVVIDLDEVKQANVQDVLDVLQKCGRTHLPVVEAGENKEIRLRGLFSTSKVLRLTEDSREAAQRKT